MELSRHGAAAHHGTKSRTLDLSVSWKDSSKTIQMYSKNRVPDFNSSSDYYYYINFTLDEVKGFISFLSKKIQDFDEESVGAFRSVVPDLVKLTNIISSR